MIFRTAGYVALLCMLFALNAFGFSDFNVLFYNYDTVGVRTNTVLTAGLPFARGEISGLGQIAMTDQAGNPLAAQFAPLAYYNDGSLHWVLADFLVPTLAQADTGRFIVRHQAASAAPASPITVDSSGTGIYVNTGAIRFRVRKTGFNLIDSLWLGGRLMLSGGAVKVNVGSAYTGTAVNKAYFEYLGPVRATLCVNGTYFTAAKGGLTFTVRYTAWAGSADLKVEVSTRNTTNSASGTYYQFSAPGGTAEFNFAPSFAGVQKSAGTVVSRSQTGYNWYEDPANGGAGMLAASRFGGGYTVDLKYHNLTLAGSTLSVCTARFADLLADLATIDRVIFLSFYNGTSTAAALDKKVRAWRYLPYAVADAGRISRYGGLSTGKFGDLYDEMQVYRNHNMQWEGASNAVYWTIPGLGETYQVNLLPSPPNGVNEPNDYVAYDCPVQLSYSNIYSWNYDTHGDSEADFVEDKVLMWIRTGNPHYLMLAYSAAGWYKTLFPLRTEGFEYAGDYAANPSGARSHDAPPSGATGIIGSRVDEVTGWNACHIYGWGLGDWYVLTGDVEAREALIDLAEIGWYHWKNATQGHWERRFSRPMLLVSRLHGLIPGDAVWKQRFDHFMSLIKDVPNWDPRGFLAEGGDVEYGYDRLFWENATKPYVRGDYYDLSQPTEPKVLFDLGEGYVKNTLYTRNMSGGQVQAWRPTFMQYWMLAYFGMGLQNAYGMTGDESIRDYLIGVGDFFYRYGINPVCNHGVYSLYLDFPMPDSIRYAEFCTCTRNVHEVNCGTYRGIVSIPVYDSIAGANKQATHSGYSDHHAVTNLTAAYEATGHPRYLDAAWRMWEKGSKRTYSSVKQLCDTNRVGYFLREGSYAGYQENIPALVAPLFYTDLHRRTSPVPSAITDLTVSKTAAPDGWALSWTTPADAGNGGEIQVKYDSIPLVSYENFKFSDYVEVLYARQPDHIPGFTAHTPHMARNVTGEPAAAAGAYQSFSLTVPWDTVYFAVFVRTPDGVMSPISNCVKGDPATAVAQRPTASVGRLSVNASPNPFSAHTRFSYNVPVARKQKAAVTLDIYDVRGRLVRTLVRREQGPGLYQLAWDGRGRAGLPAGSGIYLVKLRVGEKRLTRQITVMK